MEIMKLVGAFRELAKAPKHAKILGSKYSQTNGSLDLILYIYIYIYLFIYLLI
jgi:hypothetical protein